MKTRRNKSLLGLVVAVILVCVSPFCMIWTIILGVADEAHTAVEVVVQVVDKETKYHREKYEDDDTIYYLELAYNGESKLWSVGEKRYEEIPVGTELEAIVYWEKENTEYKNARFILFSDYEEASARIEQGESILDVVQTYDQHIGGSSVVVRMALCVAVFVVGVLILRSWR